MKWFLIILIVIIIFMSLNNLTNFEQQFLSWAQIAGFTFNESQQALIIAKCESSLNPNAHVNDSIEDSRGLMQINVKANPDMLVYDLFNPQQNLQAAYIIYKRQGWQAWTCAKKTGIV